MLNGAQEVILVHCNAKKLDHDEIGVEKNFNLSANKRPDQLFTNNSHIGTSKKFCLMSQTINELCRQKTKICNAFFLYENFPALTVNENKFHLKAFDFVECKFVSSEIVWQKFIHATGMLSIQPEEEKYSNSQNSYPYNVSYKKRPKEYKDAFVQTMFYPPATTDGHCQCDLTLADDSTLSIKSPSKKKLQSKDYGLTFISEENHWQLKVGELSQGGKNQNDNCTNCGNHKLTGETLKRGSRIRIGLSKRFKPQPLHKTF